jgi:hypothetical protein
MLFGWMIYFRLADDIHKDWQLCIDRRNQTKAN